MKNAAVYSGFTLIELVIVVSLTIILAGTALVNVTSFNQSQGLSDDIRSVMTEFRSAYSKATGVFYPTNCNGISTYTLSMTSGSKDMKITANCTSPGAPHPVEENKLGVLKSSTFSANYSYSFTVPTGSTSPLTDVEIVSDTGAVTKTLDIQNYGVFEVK